jgi:glycosyltransferase involved in cell wall biosynthesis
MGPLIAFDGRMILSSGIGRYARAALRALAEGGARLVALGRREDLLAACPGLECEVVELAARPYDPREQLAIARAVPRCDLFFSPHVTTTALPVRAGRRIAAIHDVFHLSDSADFGPAERTYSRFIYATAMRVSDAILTVSEFTRGELARRFPGSASKIRVIPNGVDPAAFFRDPARPRAGIGRYALFVGNLKPHKNLGAAVEALRAAGQGGLRLAVVGAEGGFRHGLGEEAARLRRDPSALFLGEVDDVELRRLYSHAEFLVFPSMYEGFGLPLVEAMACGCPAVCSDIPALRETGGAAALYRDAGSPPALAEGMRAVMSDAALRDRLVRAGYDRAASFGAELFASRLRAAVLEEPC